MNGNAYRCNCARCRSRGLMAPAVLITLGVLFLLQQFTFVGFGRTWPILLIVIGLVKVWQSTTSTEGHMQSYTGIPPQNPHRTLPPDNNEGQVPNV